MQSEFTQSSFLHADSHALPLGRTQSGIYGLGSQVIDEMKQWMACANVDRRRLEG